VTDIVRLSDIVSTLLIVLHAGYVIHFGTTAQLVCVPCLEDKKTFFYIHIPFCEQLCWFCTCSKFITKDYEKVKDYLKDHRVFMTSVIAGLTFGGTWNIHDKDSIKTSFPSFLNLVKLIGGREVYE
jgi:hypothetical protein